MPAAGKSGYHFGFYLFQVKIFFSTLLFLLCFINKTASQESHQNPIDGILLKEGWKFTAGDNADFAKIDFDDEQWEPIDPTVDLHYLPQIKKEPVGWFRIKFTVDSNMLNKPLAFKIYQSIASEVYLNGKLLIQFGSIGKEAGSTVAYRPNFDPGPLLFTKREQVMAVRFAVKKNLPYTPSTHPYFTFRFRILDIKQSRKFEEIGHKYPVLSTFWAGIFLTLASIHLGIFLRYKTRKADLHFSLAMFVIGTGNLIYFILGRGGLAISFIVYGYLIDWILIIPIYNLLLYFAIRQLFPLQSRLLLLTVIGLTFAGIVLFLSSYETGDIWLDLGFFPPIILSIALAWKAFRSGVKGAMIIVIGFANYLLINTSFILFYNEIFHDIDLGIYGGYSLTDLVYFISAMSVPFCLSLYLARDFAMTSRSLENKLKEVQYLSEKTIHQEKEKQEILARQKDMLELQVEERTMELKESLEHLKATQTQLIQSEKMASLGELTAGIAHEIQNPLNFVNNFSEVNTELIADMKNEIVAGNYPEVNSIAEDIDANMQKITLHGKRADAIVKSMLQHSRINSGQKEPIDINELADEYLRISYHGIRAKDKNFNATLHTEFDSRIGTIDIIPQDIGRVLLNIYNNAFYAVAERKRIEMDGYDPKVTVTTTLNNGVTKMQSVIIAVTDNGKGIPNGMIDKIFQPFFTTKPTGEGTGLGLSLSYDIIKAHGGDITVKQEPEGGVSFNIQLPIHS